MDIIPTSCVGKSALNSTGIVQEEGSDELMSAERGGLEVNR